MSNGKDSRRDPRTKVLSLTVRYKSATVAEFMENHSYDVSRGGLFIKTPSPFPPGTLLKFEVRIAEEQKVMMGVGRVTWKRDTDLGPDKPAGMGVKFIKLDPTSTELIGNLVAARSGAEAGFEEGARESGVTVSSPPPSVEPTGPSDPDKSVIAHTADILRSALDGARASSKPEGHHTDEDRQTVPNAAPPAAGTHAKSGPVSQRSLPPRPPARTPKPEAREDAAAQAAAPDAEKPETAKPVTPAAEPSETSSAAGQPDETESSERAEPVKAETAASEQRPRSEPPASSTGPKSAARERAVAALTTTPPRRGEGKSSAPEPSGGISPLVWVLGLVAVLLGGYYLVTQGQSPPTEPGTETEVAPVASPDPVASSEPEPPPVETEAPSQPSVEASADPNGAPSAETTADPVDADDTASAETPEPSVAPPPRPAPVKPRPQPARPRPAPPRPAPAPTAARPTATPPAAPAPVEPEPVAIPPVPAPTAPAPPAPPAPSPPPPRPTSPSMPPAPSAG